MDRADPKPVLFLAFANEREDRVRYLRNLPVEAAGLRDALDRGVADGLWEVVERRNATLDEILDVFQDARYRGRIVVFHFGGHAGSYELMVETASGAGAAADRAIFTAFLRQQSDLRLVFLNGCSTHGHVTDLLAAGVPDVIATSRAIDDGVATRFAIRFYQGLAGGAGIRAAFDEAAASQRPGRNASVRDIYREGEEPADERWPWDLHIRDGAEAIADWSLADAAGQPLLGLPALPSMDLPAKPYRHLNWFTRDHAHVFFGRGREVRELYERLSGPHSPPLTLLYGRSGVGKSSLLAAGLLPRLESVRATRYIRRDRNLGLRGSLRHALGMAPAAGSDAARDPLASDGHDTPLAAWTAVEQADGRPLIVVLDQVEEAFTRPNADDPSEIDDFLADLTDLFADRATRPAGKLLLGFRKEWLADIEDRLVRSTLPHGKVFLDHLGADGIVEAITGPASVPALREQYRLMIDGPLPERIAGDLLEDRDSPIAPALQILLSKLWDRATALDPDAPRFDGQLYTEQKRQGLLLEDFVDEQLAALEAWRPEESRSGLFLDFLASYTTPFGSARPRTRTELDERYAHHIDLLAELLDRTREQYLVVDTEGDDATEASGSMTRLVHDAVAQLIRRRFEASGLPGQHARRILERRARLWADGSGEPLDERELEAVEAGRTGMRTWTPDELRLVDASRNLREERLEKLRVASVIRALLTTQEAQEDPLVAGLLLAELAGLPEPDESIRIGLDVAQRPIPSDVFDEHDGGITSIAWSPGGRSLATASMDGTARIHDRTARDTCHVIDEHQDAVLCVTFSDDGSLLITGSRDGTALLWRTGQWQRPLVPLGHTGFVESAVFGPDGRWVATTSTDGTVRIWPCDGSDMPRILGGHEAGVRSASASSDGQHILTLDGAGNARVWSTTAEADAVSLVPDTDGRIREPGGRANTILAAGFSPAGTGIITASVDGAIRLWHYPLTSPPESEVLGTVDEDDVSGAERSSRRGETATSSAPTLAFAPEGSVAALASAGGITLVTTDAAAVRTMMRPDPVTLRVPGHGATSAAFSRDGSRLLTLWSDGVARLWEVQCRRRSNFGAEVTAHDIVEVTAAQILTLTHGQRPILACALSRDAERVATGDGDGAVRIWPVTGGSQPYDLPLAGRIATAIRADGDRLLVCTGEEPESTCVQTLGFRSGGEAEPELVHRYITEWELTPARTRVIARVGHALLVWSADPADSPLTVAADFTAIRSHASTPDGRFLLVHSTDLSLRMWDLDAGECVWQRRDVRQATLTPDGRLVLTHGADGAARMLESPTGDGLWLERGVSRAALQGARVWLGLADGGTLVRDLDGSNATIDVRTAEEPDEPNVLATGAERMDFDATRSRAVVRSGDGTLRLLDAGLTSVQRGFGVVSGWAWNPDGSWIATWASDAEGGSSPARLRAWHTAETAGPLELGVVQTEEEPFFLDDRRLGARVPAPVDPGYWYAWVAIWKVDEPLDDQPLILKSWYGLAGRHRFSPDGQFWLQDLAGDPGWKLHRLERATAADAPPGLFELERLSYPLPGGPDARSIPVFSPDSRRLAAVTMKAGAWWVTVAELDDASRPWLIASGAGSIDGIRFVPDGTTIELRTESGETIRVPADGPAVAVGYSPGSIVHAQLVNHASRPAASGPHAETVIVAIMADGSGRIWDPAGDGRPVVLAAPGRRIVTRSPIDVDGPVPHIDFHVGEGDTAPSVTARLDDGTTGRWILDRAVSHPPFESVAGPADAGESPPADVGEAPSADAAGAVSDGGADAPVRTSPDGRVAARLLEDGRLLAWRMDADGEPATLGNEHEVIENVEFGGHGRWIVTVARAEEEDAWREPDIVRIWDLDDPRESRVFHDAQPGRVALDWFTIRPFRRRDTMEIHSFDQSLPPLVVPSNASFIDAGTLLWVEGPNRRDDAAASAVHIARLDRVGEPIVLPAPGKQIRGACHWAGRIAARLADGRIVLWDLDWRALIDRMTAATSACLSPEQRRRLLNESEEEARERFLDRSTNRKPAIRE